MLRLATLLLLPAALFCVAPTRAAPPPALPQFTTLTVADGLPSTAVYRIAQDHDGFIWIGSHDGLARDDGVAFRIYRHDPEDPRSLSSNDVEALLIDSQGRVWCGGEASGLNRLEPDGNGFRHWRHVANDASTLPSDDIWALAEDGRGTVWVGTALGGLGAISLDEKFRRFEHDPDDATSLRSNNVVALHVGEGDRLWIGTDSGLDVREPDGRIMHVALPPMEGRPGSAAVQAFLQEADGVMLVGTGRGLFRIGTDYSFLGEIGADNPLAVSALARDVKGTVWIGLMAGLARLDPSGVWRYPTIEATVPGALPGKRIWHIISDTEGGLWFAVLDGGVARLPPDWQNFSVFRHVPGNPASLSNARVAGLAVNERGVWVISGRDGVDRIDPASGAVERYGDRVELDSRQLWSSIFVHQDTVWIGHHAGIYIQPLGGGEGSNLPVDPALHNALPPGIVVRMVPTRDGKLWVVSQGGGVAEVDVATAQVLRRYVPGNETLDNVDMRRLILDREDRPWLATTTGLRRLDANGRHFITPQGSPGDVVLSIAFVPDGSLWLQRLGALERYRIDADTVTRVDRFDSRNGWPALAEGDLAVDRNGNVWATSPRGLWRAEPESRRIRRFDQHDGLPSAEFLPRSLAVGPDGTLYAGTLTGAVAFDPNTLQQESVVPPLRVVGLSVRRDDVKLNLDPDQPIRLGYNDRDLAVSVRALSYANPSSNRYGFRLSGYDNDWIDSQHGERVFSQLPAGHYTLAIRGAGAGGLWGGLKHPIIIDVTPPPWATPWARALYLVAAALLIAMLFAAYRARIRRRHALTLAEERRLDAERLADAKSSFLANMGHEIRTPLTSLLGMTELMFNTDLDECQLDYTEGIRQSGELLLRQVNDSLDLARMEAGRLTLDLEPLRPQALLNAIVALERPLAEQKGIRLQCAIAQDAPICVLGDVLRLKQILLNLVNNSLKFTHDGSVTLGCARTEEGVKFTVSDTGPGIPEELRARLFQRFTQGADSAARHGGSGLGLAICRELAELMGGRIGVSSEPGRGTTFSIELPLAEIVEDVNVGSSPDFFERSLPRQPQTAISDAAATTGSDHPLAQASSAPTPQSKPAPLHGLDVLLVEDDNLVAAAVTGLLESLGHHAHHANNGLTALAELKRRRFDASRFDIALLDLDLPGIDGLALARMIRKGVTGDIDLPLVAVTARSAGSEEARCHEAGFNGFLRKPVTAARLDAEIRRIVQPTGDTPTKIHRSGTASPEI